MNCSVTNTLPEAQDRQRQRRGHPARRDLARDPEPSGRKRRSRRGRRPRARWSCASCCCRRRGSASRRSRCPTARGARDRRGGGDPRPDRARGRTPEPDEAACRRYYEHNRERFRSADLFEAAHILIAARPDDVAARAAAADGRAIWLPSGRRAVRRTRPRHSACPRRSRAAISDSCRAARRLRNSRPRSSGFSRRIRQPVETRYGFHVIRLDRHRRAVLPFELVHERIRDYLTTSVAPRVAQYVSMLAGRADIAGSRLLRRLALLQ